MCMNNTENNIKISQQLIWFTIEGLFLLQIDNIKLFNK